MATEQILSTGENTFKAKYRFRNPYDLWSRFNDVHGSAKETDGERKKLIQMYERYPYQIPRGKKIMSEPNWGIFTDSINDYVKFYCTIALDRKVWCRIETYEGMEEKMDTTYSDIITEAFHKYCINAWHDKDEQVIAAIQDDAFFNKGALIWDCPFDTYPEHIPAEDIYPDTNATTCVDSFDLLFVRDRLSVVELYEKAIEDDFGWNKTAILRALTYSVDTLKDCSTKDVVEQFRRGGISQIDQDKLINVIYCYVKEYREAPEDHKRPGYQISLLVIPENLIALGVDMTSEMSVTKSSQLLKRKDYFQFVEYYAKDFDSIISLWTSNIKRGFYNDASFAKQIYLGCRFHDLTTNSIIRAIRRSMRLWIKTGSNETRKRMQTMDADEEVGLLTQDDDIAQIGIRQDVSAATELLRTTRASISAFSPVDFQGTNTSPKGYPITKGEASILSQQLDDSKAMSVKLFISKNRMFCDQLYTRFVNSTKQSDSWENFKRFKKYLTMKGVPDAAWKRENVEIFPRFNQFAGQASSNYATAQALVQATQIKPASRAEQLAKQNLIASIIGEANVSEYMDELMQFDQEIFIIGQENEALDNPLANPENLPVTPSDNHMVHIQGHIQDYIGKLSLGNQLLNQAAQEQSYRKLFFIEHAADIVNSQDNKGAHIAAHFQIMERDESKADELKPLAQTFQQVQQQQDQLAMKIQQLQKQETQANSRGNMADLEFQHAQRMKELEYNSAKAMSNLSAEQKLSQIDASAKNTEVKQQQKASAKQEDQAIKTEGKQQDMALKTADKSIDIRAKQTALEIEQAKAKVKLETEKQKANDKKQSTKNNG